MASFQKEITMNYNECIVKSLDKNQDIAFCGRVEREDSNDSYEWFIGCDGHGRNTFNDLLKLLDWNLIAENSDSIIKLQKCIDEMNVKTHNSGATYYEAKLYNNRVETCVVGDSQIAVFIDSVLVYISTPHNMKNPLELQRLNKRIELNGVSVKKDNPVPKIFDATTLKLEESEYVYFEDGDRISMSQALGHNNITGISPEKNIILFEPGQEICIIGGSDGLWEMINLIGSDSVSDLSCLLTKNVSEIADMIEGRWKQDWNIIWTDSIGKERKFVDSFTNKNRSVNNPSSGYDDISVCKIYKK